MAYLSRVSYLSVSGGQLIFPVTFPYLDQVNVGVFVGVAGSDPFAATPLVLGVDYNWTSSGVIATTAAHDGFDVHIRRTTPSQVDTLSGGTLTANAQNRIDLQLLYLNQETTDAAADLTARALRVPVGETPPVVNLTGMAEGQLVGLVDGVLAPITNIAGEILAAQVAKEAGIYPDLVTGAAATPSGGFYFVSAPDEFIGAQNVGGTGTELYSFNIQRAMRQVVSEGLPILSMGTESAVTGDAGDYIREFGDLCKQYGGGTLKFPGEGYVFEVGGAPVTLGTFGYILSGETTEQSVPFNKGLIEIQNGMRLEGQGAKLLLAPGYTCPPPMFYSPYWLSEQRTGFHLKGLELDGNQANQIVFPTNAAGAYNTLTWLFGNAVTHIGVSDVSARECTFRNWRGMALGGGPAPDYGLLGDNFLAEHCEFVDNFNGSIQWAGRRLRTLHNYHHGNGGWTAFVDIEVESEAAGYEMLDIWSIGEVFDGRDGVAPPESFIQPVNGSPGYATDSSEALGMQVHYRRGYCLSGNYSTPNTDVGAGGDLIFNGQKGRISVVHPKLWQTNVSTGGCAVVHVDSPQIAIAYEPNAAFMFAQDQSAISASPANNTNNNIGLTEFKVSNAIIQTDTIAPAFFCGGYDWVEFTGSIVGSRNSGIRLENCGGKVDARIKNVGGVDAGGLVGSGTSGITTFGNSGPLDIRLHVSDDRGAGAKMNYAAYVNSSTAHIVNVEVMSSSGMLLGNVNDVNTSSAVLDRSTLVTTLNRALKLSAGLEVHGATSLVSDSGDLTLTLNSPSGANSHIIFETGGVAEAQIVHTSDGSLQTLLVDTAGDTIVTTQLLNSGVVGISASWEHPIQALGGAYLWVTAAGEWRTSTTRPTADTDGVALGSQT